VIEGKPDPVWVKTVERRSESTVTRSVHKERGDQIITNREVFVDSETGERVSRRLPVPRLPLHAYQ